MSERGAFLRAIAADPADDTVRLAFADWLDENREPERAEFIRLQIERARSGEPDPDDLPPREQSILDAKRAEWLGPLAQLKGYEGFDPTFRRGFVDAVTVHGNKLAELTPAITEYCPLVTVLELVGIRGHGEALASLDLPSLRTLRIEDWPRVEDLAPLATSRSFRRVDSLSVWLGSQHDADVFTFLASPATPHALHRIELIQLYGGMQAGDSAAIVGGTADNMRNYINEAYGAEVATVSRPFDCLFPLAPHVGYDLDSGTVPDGRQVLVRCGRRCELMYFDADGHLTSGEVLDLSADLHGTPEYNFQSYNRAEVHKLLRERVGFEPAMIHVREFNEASVIPDGFVSVYKFSAAAIEDPDGEYERDPNDWINELEGVRYWLRTTNFCIGYGNECWADHRGQIHTT